MKKDIDLAEARKIIDEVDAEMAALFTRRMQAVAAVAAYKQAHGLPILDEARENEVIARNAARVEDAELREFYVQQLGEMMRVSRRYQERLFNGMRVAFCGVEGAFAAIAAKKIFPDAERVPYPDFRAAYDAVLSGECDSAVLPIENSTAGEVGNVLDMLFFGSLHIAGVYDLFIAQHLMACAGTHRADIKKVISHPQALAQCAEYLREHGYATEPYENTALAACYVAEQKDPTLAAIASAETAELYGLKILEKNVNQKNMNMTRFAVLTRAVNEDASVRGRHSILMFTVSNEAGALAEAINIIGKYGYNMRCLRSRPMKELVWQYYFYVETEGNLFAPRGKEMLAELSHCCDKLKVLGSFAYPAELH
ncbi:MAG: chorismate mutase [Clostridia bacterium]|nr:chorismate mutase [Clostridia bacterium]